MLKQEAVECMMIRGQEMFMGSCSREVRVMEGVRRGKVEMASGHGDCAGLGGWGSSGSSSISAKTSDGAGVGDGEWGAQPET